MCKRGVEALGNFQSKLLEYVRADSNMQFPRDRFELWQTGRYKAMKAWDEATIAYRLHIANCPTCQAYLDSKR